LAESDNLAYMAVISVRVEKSGRILIPVAIRRRLGLKDGDSELLLNIDEQPIRVSTRAQALARLQEFAARYGNLGELWSDELSEERRRETARDLAE
jgi:AbrB family looped-hinge helix DNA binding protein